ncbi:MAG: hypothetical protein HFG54_12080 [Lachnospiraceae bacterium]|jgi:hypothetical protein|nr:hypothetical protein [Lachnospiraceae bacterium]
MSQYTPTTGTILQIQWQDAPFVPQDCGTLRLTLQTMDQGLTHITVSGSTYVLNSRPLRTGDQITCFYSLLAPVPMIYPPLYHAVVIVPTSAGTYAALDRFTYLANSHQLTNSDDTLRLNISNQTRVMLPNGQPFGGSLSGKLLLVIYSATTRSIPAQTTPDQIIVFCQQ